MSSLKAKASLLKQYGGKNSALYSKPKNPDSNTGTSFYYAYALAFFFFFFFSILACGILVPLPGSELVSPTVEGQS